MTTHKPAALPVLVFSVVYAVAYVIAVWKNLALFTYHPATGTLAFGVEKAQDGPAMYWFGWIAMAAIPALAAAGIAALLPANNPLRTQTAWAWIVPLAVLVFFAYLLRGYFLR